MAIEIASSFDMKAQLPIDGRYVVDDLTARDAIDSGVRHEGMQVYVKSEGLVYFLNGGVANENWVEMGSGSGGGEGGINYIKNGNAEQIVNPWLSYSDGTPYPISGGTSVGSDVMTRSDTDPIRGTHSWVTDDISVGNGYRLDFEIDEADVGRSLTVSLDAQFLDTPVTQLWSVWIYDVLNTKLLKLRGDNPNSNSYGGGTGQNIPESEDISFMSFEFDATDSTQYRLLLHKGELGSGAIKFDSLRVQPKSPLTPKAGSGGINLESSPYAQDGDNDWAIFDDGATATGVDLTGGTATATFAADKDDTSILSGDFQGAYKISYTAADHQGEGVSKEFSIPKAFRDKGYFLVSARYSATAALATGDMIFRAYDVTNSELIASTGLTDYKIPGIAANGTGSFTVIVPIQSNTASVRLGFMRAVTTATAFDFCFSDFRVGPPQALMVPPVQKQVEIDLTGVGDFTGGKILVTRNGGQVTITGDGDFTFSSTHNPGAASILPEWARPAATVRNSYLKTVTTTQICIVSSAGTFSLFLRNHDGTAASATTASNPTISYSVEDNSSNIVDVAELELKAETIVASRASAIPTGANNLSWETISPNSLFTHSNGVFTALKDVKAIAVLAVAYADSDNGGLANGQTSRFYYYHGSSPVAGTQLTAVNGTDVGNRIDPLTIPLDLKAGESFRFGVSHNKGSDAAVAYCNLTIQILPDLTAIAAIAAPSEKIEAKGSVAYGITAGQWGDLTSISVPPGEWNFDVQVVWRNTAAVTATTAAVGVGTVSGNNSPGAEGEWFTYDGLNQANGYRTTQTFFARNVVVTEETTYYLKTLVNASIANLSASYKITAQRVK